VTQGPWQRRLDLATLHLDSAGSRIRATALHRDVGEALELAQRTTEQSRQVPSPL
jgi:putative membrane protein